MTVLNKIRSAIYLPPSDIPIRFTTVRDLETGYAIYEGFMSPVAYYTAYIYLKDEQVLKLTNGVIPVLDSENHVEEPDEINQALTFAKKIRTGYVLGIDNYMYFTDLPPKLLLKDIISRMESLVDAIQLKIQGGHGGNNTENTKS